ncbi:tyrosine--tRNA ligase [Peredibacter starrii]|uniref:Tyrosine--tRNA ligase n=1 Tax=Peredibacter starrii TaxID=28202 RepID=A0AAX4HRL5_9BACT|nr:tyrosine--tRNA ligase [Peredibacter starrii]WPU65939.1 tyrosine--tRNA ligase [Peredibacter starrii]
MARITVLPEQQLAELKRGAFEILPEEEMLKKLKKSYETQKPLKIKLGADPSRPDIHLGHTVVLQKLRLFQEFGHEIYFLIGDYTAQIGDPTGKNKTRPILSDEEVKENAKTYSEQIGKILDLSKTHIVFNKDWLGKFSGLELIQLMGKATVGALLQRDDFNKRYTNGEAIYLHEFVYPVLQGYDSVHLKADVELGGTDQTFNLMMGRQLQYAYGQEAQCILTMPLLEGTDGVNKMSKSLDNYIGLTDTPTNMFGKIMSISDELMKKYYLLLCRRPAVEVEAMISGLTNGTIHPMEAKKALASEITGYYHGEAAGKEEREKFEARFSKKQIPDDIQTITRPAGTVALLDFFLELGLIKSKSDGRRLIQQNAVKVNFENHTTDTLNLEKGQELILKIGKLRMVKLIGE